MPPLIIIGSGLAGYNLAREFRKLDKLRPVTILTRDDGEFYSKPMLSNALAKQKTPAQLVMTAAADMAKELQADIRTRCEVTHLDTAGHRVQLAGGDTLEFGQCVLAVGARPIRLPIAGNAAGSILQVNNLHDYAVFRAALAGKTRVAIIGPGLIGCEFANDLLSAGIAVHVIGPDHHPLGRLLPPAVGQAVQHALQQAGVHWHLQTTVNSVDTVADGLQITLANGEQVTVDMVLSAVGLQADTALANNAGLKTNRGMVVNRLLQTSDADIYALGDCAEVEGLVLPYVLPLMQCARALAKTLAGETTPVSYPPMPVLVKTPACPLVVSPPPAGASGGWQIESRSDGIAALYKSGESLLGFALSGSATADKAALTKLLPPLLG